MAFQRILARAVHTVFERAHRAPRDPKPRVVQAPERRPEPLPVREQRVVPDAHVVHEHRARERAAQGELVLDRGGGEPFCALLEEESAHFAVPFAARPDDEDVAELHTVSA